MAQHTFAPTNAFNMSSGLASRRGGQSLKPLNELALKAPSQDIKENTVPTPRTSRGHLLANLRTAPKTATAASFAAADNDHNARSHASLYAAQEAAMNNGPKTSLPYGTYGAQVQAQAQAQAQGSANWMAYGQQQQQQQQQQQHFTPEQILAPPEIHIDEQGLDPSMDPDLYARLMQQNMQLAQQRFMLQQQLHSLTQAQQQLDAMNLNGNQAYANMYQQQLLQQQQAILAAQAAQQPQVYTYIDPATGQQAFYVDQSGQLGAQLQEQAQLNNTYQVPQSSSPAPRLEISPPRESTPVFRRTSPARRNASPLLDDPTPLPPPSANAFRRGHKKSASLMLKDINNLSNGEPQPSAGPRTANFPVTPLTGSYGPGQARAGEHPIRQPRGPPAIEELKAKPTSKMEGSKNFAARTRRSAINNLKRAGVERRKVTGSSSSGSISPISETAEDIQSPLSDNESESGRSGSGSLNGEDVEPSVPSSRTSTGSWGAIGSDRPSSAQKARKSAGSVSSGSGDEAASNGSFASVFKRSARTSGRSSPETPGGRKAPMMVLTNAEKRKNGFFA
ncbi:unnamed protein product [Discula destructiva]